MRVLDILGICVAATPLDTSQAARDWAAGPGRPAAGPCAVGMPEPVPAALAAFVNGVLAHSLDYDDTHLPSVLHPSACVVPAALAAAQYAGADGRGDHRGHRLGLEICVRLGMAGYRRDSQTSVFFEHGQHATSICGTVAAAVSAGTAPGAGRRPASSTPSASPPRWRPGSSRPTGPAARSSGCTAGGPRTPAVSAAQLAATGFTGPPTVLEGRFGFFQAWLHGDADPAALTDGLGSTWAVPGIFFKPYPANHFTHAAIDAAIALRAAGLEPGTSSRRSSGWRPRRGGLSASRSRSSAPRTPATWRSSAARTRWQRGLLGGGGLGVGLADFTDELARDPARRELMARVSVVADDGCTQIFPYQFPAVLQVRTKEGRTCRPRS